MLPTATVLDFAEGQTGAKARPAVKAAKAGTSENSRFAPSGDVR